jgi:AP-3 complex subunit mu
MFESFFVLTASGEVLIEKHWRGLTNRAVCDFFWDEVSKSDNREETPPVIVKDKYYIVSILRNNIFFVGTTKVEMAPLSSIEFLHRVFDIFEEYFSTVEESTIKDNFSTIYQLLEEMMDFGFPLTTEPNALQAMIKPPSIVSRVSTAMGQESGQISDKLADGVISNMPWRRSGVLYSQNEIYMDIVEEVDSILSVDGVIISSEVSGSIQAVSRLSGVPDLTLQLSDPKCIDDCSFHPCVRYNRFERDQLISFVPPDGQFELMRFRVNSHGNHAVAPCYCSPNITYELDKDRGNITLVAGARASSSLLFPGDTKSQGFTPIEDVVVTIPFMRNVRTANLSVTSGTVLYDEATKVAKWKIGNITSSVPLRLTGQIFLQPATVNSPAGNTGTEESPPIQMDWTVPSASISGMSVASLTMVNASYKPYKGVRTIAKSGKFQIRTV